MAEEPIRKRRITLHLYDTDMSMNIPADEEEFYRRGEKLMTQVMNYYSSRYKGIKTDKEICYMALIDVALRYEKEAARHDTAPVEDILSRLTAEIEEALRETK